MNTSTPSPSKISVKVWLPVIDALEKRMEAACLRRDAYLNRVLAVELDHLDREVSIPNSKAARDFVADRLNQLPRKSVSLALQPELAARLDTICTRKRIVRDAFFNRLFLLLAAKSNLIDLLIFPGADNWRTEVWSEAKHEGPFFENTFYPLDPDIDPFWPMRRAFELFADDTLIDYVEPETGETIRVQKSFDGDIVAPDALYTVVFQRKLKLNGSDSDLYGLNCYLPDFRIPDHPAEQRHRHQLDDMFRILSEPETAPITPLPKS